MLRIDQEVKKHVGEGIMAHEDTVRINTDSEIKVWMEDNQDKPETWEAHINESLGAYEKSRDKRAKDDGWSKQVVEADRMQYEDFKARFVAQTNIATKRASIRKSNANIETNAQAYLRGGYHDKFKEAMNKMNLAPEAKQRAIRDGLEQGLYRMANNELDSISEQTPAEQLDSYGDFVGRLTAKNDDGAHSEWEEKEGGMALGQRVNLQSIAGSRARAAQRQMDVTGRSLVASIRAGKATASDVQAALDDGEIDERTAMGLDPYVKQATEERRAKVAEDANDQAIRKAKSADSLTATVLEKKEAGLREVEQQVVLGVITGEQGKKIAAQLELASTTEIQDPEGEYRSIKADMAAGWWDALDKGAEGAQRSDPAYIVLQNRILNAEVTQPTRLRLMDDLMLMKITDINDLEEEGTGAFADRDITAGEKDLRKGMLETYRKLSVGLGATQMGDAMFGQERRIRSFYDAYEGNPPPVEVAKLKEVLESEVRELSGAQTVEEAFGDLLPGS